MGNKIFAIRPFEKLKKKIESKPAVPAPAPARQKKKEHLTEEELFSQAMDAVLENEDFRSLACAHHPKKIAVRAGKTNPDHEALAVLGEIVGGQRPMHLPDTQEYVEWINPDYHDVIILKLHEGRFSVQAFLDLHGCTVPEAEAELHDFLQDAFRKGLRCVKIIHGRGLRSVKGPRIKDAVIRRLAGRYRKNVIAYVTARQCDGGLGALYVLIRK
ncbi:MAG: Smr/MutS family endonuclease [Nitrospirae bacterium]|nr:Smr/MutS family endonuclease [Nitrospirota bacterium]